MIEPNWISAWDQTSAVNMRLSSPVFHQQKLQASHANKARNKKCRQNKSYNLLSNKRSPLLPNLISLLSGRKPFDERAWYSIR